MKEILSSQYGKNYLIIKKICCKFQNRHYSPIFIHMPQQFTNIPSAQDASRAVAHRSNAMGITRPGVHPVQKITSDVANERGANEYSHHSSIPFQLQSLSFMDSHPVSERQSYNESRPAFQPKQLKTAFPVSTGVVQRVLWKFDDGRWNAQDEVVNGKAPAIEGKAGQIYDDAREALYENSGDHNKTEQILALLAGKGKIDQLQILETDVRGNEYGGFKQKIVTAITKLVQKPSGRMLIQQLAAGGQTVTIRPDKPGSEAVAGPDAPMLDKNFKDNEETPLGRWIEPEIKPGPVTDATVLIPSNMDDNTMKAYDANFELLDQPFFVTLGHELVHASHMTKGMAYHSDEKKSPPLTDPEYHNREEEVTIAGEDEGQISENTIRREHNLPLRFGHDGVDTTNPVIKTASIGFNNMGPVLDLLGTDIGTVLSLNPEEIDNCLAVTGVVEEYLKVHPELLEEFKESLKQINWQDIFTEHPKELQPLLQMYNPEVFKGLNAILNEPFHKLNEIDEVGFNTFAEAVQHEQINTDEWGDNPLSVLIEKEPKLRPLIDQHINFINKDDVENHLETIQPAMIDLLILSNPALAARHLAEQQGIEQLVEQMKGDNTNELKIEIIKSYSGTGNFVAPSKLVVPGCKMYRITKLQAANGPEKCLENIAGKFTLPQERIKECNAQAKFTAGENIIICTNAKI